MANAIGVNSLQLDGAAPTVRSVAGLWCVCSRRIWLGIVEAKDASPLLDGLVIVGWRQCAVSAAMVDLHLGIATGKSRVHVFHHLQRVSVRVPDVRTYQNGFNAFLTPAQTCGVLWI